MVGASPYIVFDSVSDPSQLEISLHNLKYLNRDLTTKRAAVKNIPICQHTVTLTFINAPMYEASLFQLPGNELDCVQIRANVGFMQF